MQSIWTYSVTGISYGPGGGAGGASDAAQDNGELIGFAGGYGGGAAQQGIYARATQGLIVITYTPAPIDSTYTEIFTSASTWLVPAGVGAIKVEAIGPGSAGSNAMGQKGGGGGGYSKTNATPVVAGSLVYINVPTTGSAYGSTADTWLNTASNTAPTSTSQGALAKGASSGSGGASASGIGDVKYSGGNGGNNTVTGTYVKGGGGGASAGPNGAGLAGGNGWTGATTGGGGGGGAYNNGTSATAGNATATAGGAGGSNYSSGGAGATSSSAAGNGTNGSGGGGGSASTSNTARLNGALSLPGTIWSDGLGVTYGLVGGTGGTGINSTPSSGVVPASTSGYGGGGGGSSAQPGIGRPGLLVITYSPNFIGSGNLVGPGAVVVGSASRTSAAGPHLSSGTLAGQGSSIVGAAARTAHGSIGVLSGTGSAIAGMSRRFHNFDTSGNLPGQVAIIAGVASGPFSLANPKIRYADFFRLTTVNGVYLFSTAPFAITVPSVSPDPFTALGQLIKVGGAQRDIKSTANETTITMVGIDTAMLGIVLAEKIKGSKIELWHGFFNNDNQLVTATGTGLYQYFSGYVNTFSISEEWMEEARSFAGAITISASSFQLILQNRTSGRYTNDAAWKAVNPTDTSMNRVNFISTINYAFGKTPT
jgi:hypothetical protein